MTKAEQEKTGLKGQDKLQGEVAIRDYRTVSSASARVHTDKDKGREDEH
jgi:hypothetical protein